MNAVLISIWPEIDLMGLKYLHYCLLRKGCNSYLLNMLDFDPADAASLAEIRKFIAGVSPAFIGISVASAGYYQARDLTRCLKKDFKDVPVLWGGPHPTVAPEMCLEDADYVCVGEGERTIVDVAEALENGKGLKTVRNLCYLENGIVRRNALHQLIADLDVLPVCDHIPVNGFIQERNGRITAFDERILRKYTRYKGSLYNTASSRGCPFSCAYCAANVQSKLYRRNTFRRRSVENIIHELEKAVQENPGIEYVNFYDDCFLSGDGEYLNDFCDAYKKDVAKPFIARAIPIYVSREKVRRLKDAGMAWICLGLQSGSDRVCRDVYKRPSSRADFLSAARIVHELEVAPFYDIILDNPFESEEDVFETARTFCETPKPFFPQFFSLNFFLGTDLREKALKECPERLQDPLEEDILLYRNTPVNKILRLSAFLGWRFVHKLILMYKRDREGIGFKTALFFARLISSAVLEPLTYFKLIRLSQKGSYTRTMAVLPNYFREGLSRYLIQFRDAKAAHH